MKQESTNKERRFPLWWCGIFLGILGAVAIQLAGLPISTLHIPEVSGKQDCEALTAIISNSSPLSSRQLRSNRYRAGAQGRLNNFRNGSDGSSTAEWHSAPQLLPVNLSKAHFCLSLKSDNHWIDFIISALPARAGPTA